MNNQYFPIYPMYPMPYSSSLESMYPEIYNTVNPEVVKYCNMMEMSNGNMYSPTKEQYEKMVDDIYIQVEPQMKKEVEAESSSDKMQYGQRRGFLRDIIGILLIRQLLGRRGRRGRGRGRGRGYNPYYNPYYNNPYGNYNDYYDGY